MPTYVYRREDGTTFEIMQRITESALEVCPTTGQSVKRVIGGGIGVLFKGSGFYETDYVRKSDGGKKEKTETTSVPKTEPAASTKKTTDASSST